MTEFEIIDDKLVIVCDHEWGSWLDCRDGTEIRYCKKCNQDQLLVPRGWKNPYAPDPLPARSSFSLFLADFKARFNK